MSVRAQVAAQLVGRVSAHCAQALGDLWDREHLTVVLEGLSVESPVLSDAAEWQAVCGLNGVLALVLHEESVDALDLLPLLAALIDTPVALLPPDNADPGDVAVDATLTPRDLRDSLGDLGLRTVLRLDLEGRLVRRLDAPPITAIYAAANGEDPVLVAGEEAA
ncbi:MAG: hypothetical protein H6931_17685 [Burkholderiaceae bacterium]|nr:hypothetical protein [Zoogloeaceae bacterium]MCP5290923.1 hypothetical protein [Burkholderiaceae bacterium]